MLKLYKEDLAAATLIIFVILLLGSLFHYFILQTKNEFQNLIVFIFVLLGAIVFLLLFMFSIKLSDDYKRKESPNAFICLVSFSGFALFLLALLLESIIISTESQGTIGFFYLLLPGIIWYMFSLFQMFTNAGYLLYVLFAKEKNLKTFFDNSLVFLVGIVLSFINTFWILNQQKIGD